MPEVAQTLAPVPFAGLTFASPHIIKGGCGQTFFGMLALRRDSFMAEIFEIELKLELLRAGSFGVAFVASSKPSLLFSEAAAKKQAVMIAISRPMKQKEGILILILGPTEHLLRYQLAPESSKARRACSLSRHNLKGVLLIKSQHLSPSGSENRPIGNGVY